MRLNRTLFKSIVEAHGDVLGEWSHFIPGHIECIEACYQQGDEIGEQAAFPGIELDRPIAIVVAGRAELYEIYMLQGLPAYRPIRVMGPGDLFGEFAILDHHLGIPGDGRKGETWRISAGYKSFILASHVAKDLQGHFQNFDEAGNLIDEECLPHRYFDDALRDSQTVVAFVPSNWISGHDGALDRLLRYAWPRAKLYRDCLNSFNLGEKTAFHDVALREVKALLNNRRLKYSKKTSSKTLLPLFIDAVLDACNRTVRQEPMFGIDPALRTPSVVNRLAAIGLRPEHVYSAVHVGREAPGEFWFPIDVGNYLLASYTHKRDDLQDALRQTLGGLRAGKKSSLNPRRFYADLARNLAKKALQNGSKAEFDVDCVDVGGLGHRNLLLHFKRPPK